MLNNTVKMHTFLFRHVYQLMPTNWLNITCWRLQEKQHIDGILLIVWLKQQSYPLFHNLWNHRSLPFFRKVAVSNFAKRSFLSNKSQPFLLCFINLSSHAVLLPPQKQQTLQRIFPFFHVFCSKPKLTTILCYHHDMPKQQHISSHDHCFPLLQSDYYRVAHQMLEKRYS